MGLDGSTGEDSEKGWCKKSVLAEAQRGMLLGQRRWVERSSRLRGPKAGDGLHMNEGIRGLEKSLQPLPRRICLQLLWNC